MSNQETVLLFYRFKSYSVGFVEVQPTDIVQDALEKMIAQCSTHNLDVVSVNLYERGSSVPLKKAARISEVIDNNSEDNCLELRKLVPKSMFSLSNVCFSCFLVSFPNTGSLR